MLRKMLLMIVLLSGFSLSFAAHSVKPAKPLKLLFIQVARSGLLTSNAKSDNTYTLTLSNLDPYVTYFADRPKRITGLMPLPTFIKNWSKGTNSFALDRPNVGLEAILTDTTHGEQYIFKMGRPRYDHTTKTMRYTVVALPNQRPIKNTLKFSHVALFIDDSSCNAIGGGEACF